MLSKDGLMTLSEIDLESVNPQALKELTEIHIDSKLPIKERFEKLLNEINNPYIFKINETNVKISFSNHNNLTIDDCLKTYLKDAKNSENV